MRRLNFSRTACVASTARFFPFLISPPWCLDLQQVPFVLHVKSVLKPNVCIRCWLVCVNTDGHYTAKKSERNVFLHATAKACIVVRNRNGRLPAAGHFGCEEVKPKFAEYLLGLAALLILHSGCPRSPWGWACRNARRKGVYRHSPHRRWEYNLYK